MKRSKCKCTCDESGDECNPYYKQNCNTPDSHKYKQALEEIREMLPESKCKYACFCFSCPESGQCKEEWAEPIKRIITEAIGDSDNANKNTKDKGIGDVEKEKNATQRQENEKLEAENKALKEEIKRNGFGCFNIEMAEQLDQLKSLIEKYEECNKYLVEENGKTYTRLEYKLLRTINEIKPILEIYANSSMGEEQPDKTYHIRLNGGYIMVYDPKPARQALQKISECGAERRKMNEVKFMNNGIKINGKMLEV